MNTINILDFINETKINTPNENEFLNLSNLLPVDPLYPKQSIFNYERGILLYSLIAKYKPKTVLEIGTATGYSTLCMARAMCDFQIPGKIYTIDPESINRKIELVSDIDLLTKKILTLKDHWSKIAPPEWLTKVEPIIGYSGRIMSKHEFPKIEFAYIDGAHFFEAVKHDFYAILKVVSDEFNILFDDYTPGLYPNGVSKLIDEEISQLFTVTVIDTDLEKRYQQIKQTYDYNDKSKIFHAMCLIQSKSLKKSLNEIISDPIINKNLEKYRRYEKRWAIRRNLNQKIPFLKNIAFSKYFKK